MVFITARSADQLAHRATFLQDRTAAAKQSVDSARTLLALRRKDLSAAEHDLANLEARLAAARRHGDHLVSKVRRLQRELRAAKRLAVARAAAAESAAAAAAAATVPSEHPPVPPGPVPTFACHVLPDGHWACP